MTLCNKTACDNSRQSVYNKKSQLKTNQRIKAKWRCSTIFTAKTREMKKHTHTTKQKSKKVIKTNKKHILENLYYITYKMKSKYYIHIQYININVMKNKWE